MPQEIRVLQCYDCKTFQVDIVKKAKKWSCKMCGAKQSIMKVFFRGTGADCRLKAQQLNMEKGLKQEKVKNEALEFVEDEEIDWHTIEDEASITNSNETAATTTITATTSKWAAYVDDDVQNIARKNTIATNDSKKTAYENVQSKNKCAAAVANENEFVRPQISETDVESTNFEFDKDYDENDDYEDFDEDDYCDDDYLKETEATETNDLWDNTKNEEEEDVVNIFDYEFEREKSDCSTETNEIENTNNCTEFNAEEVAEQQVMNENDKIKTTDCAQDSQTQSNTSFDCPIYDEETDLSDAENVEHFNFENKNRTNSAVVGNKRKCTNDNMKSPAKIKKLTKWDKFL